MCSSVRFNMNEYLYLPAATGSLYNNEVSEFMSEVAPDATGYEGSAIASKSCGCASYRVLYFCDYLITSILCFGGVDLLKSMIASLLVNILAWYLRSNSFSVGS